jgi:phage/plasmid-associated DNA primase
MYEGAKSYEEWDASLSSKELADKFLELYGDNVVMSGDKLFVFYEEQRKTENEEQKTGRWFDETDEKKRHKLTIMISEDLHSIQLKEIKDAVELKKEERNSLLKINRRMTSALCNVKDIMRHIITRAKHTLTEFNSDPLLLGFENGVYDLRKDKFRPYTYSDFITISTKYDYKKPDYTDPTVVEKRENLVKVIESIHPNPEKRLLYLQALASGLDGFCYQNLFLFNGQGGNGKGLTGGLMDISLGDYYYQPNNGIIKDMYAEKANTPSPDMLNLRYKRYINFKEVGGSVCGAMVKNLTGDGKFVGRMLNCNPETFELCSTVVMEYNDDPEFDGEMGEAFERRLVNMFFEINFTENEGKLAKGEKGRITYAKANKEYVSKEWKLSIRDVFLDMLLGIYGTYNNKEREVGLDFTIPECVTRATIAFMDNQNPFNKIAKELFDDVKVEKGDDIEIGKNSITVKDMFNAIYQSFDYCELSIRQKKTYNRKAFKKWVLNEYKLITPKGKAEQVVGVILKSYENGDELGW